MLLAALLGSDAAHHLGAVFNGLRGVKRSLCGMECKSSDVTLDTGVYFSTSMRETTCHFCYALVTYLLSSESLADDPRILVDPNLGVGRHGSACRVTRRVGTGGDSHQRATACPHHLANDGVV